MGTKIGATGKFPQGQMHPGDEGELTFGVASDGKGNVHINFGKDISWFALPQVDAINFASLILKHAGVRKFEIELRTRLRHA